jgi:phosphate transport system substrate-binding protein
MDKMIKTTLLTLGFAVFASSIGFAQTRDQIRITGSSTVYPFTTTVAEAFGKMGFKSPIVEATGTGGGIKIFCETAALTSPDATNASRRIKLGEFELCQKNGVKDILELKIGYDGLTLAASKKTQPLNLTRTQIFYALAKDVPNSEGKLIPNPYKLWSEIDSSLPARKIEVMGPPPTSGTRDSVHELFLEPGAEAILALKALKASDPKAFEKLWKSVREDGAYIEAGENDNLIVQKLTADPNVLGIFGYSFLAENTGSIQAVKIEGVVPVFETISNGSYKPSRELFVYFKKANIGQVKGLDKFLAEFISNKAVGEDGYLEKKGLVPLPKEALAKTRSEITAQTTMTGEGLSK